MLERIARLVARNRAKKVPEEPRTDISETDTIIIERVRPYTMTTDERLVALIDSVRYLAQRGVSGDFAECGVWRGGSVMAMLLALMEHEDTEREVYLFDTFEGMTKPGPLDVSRFQRPALQSWEQATVRERRPWEQWFQPELSGLEAVRRNALGTGYPNEQLHFVAGPVEETLPGGAPEELALLRLDTDWYESTRHELRHLYPRLTTGGVLIIDDYGHWEGCRRAVDEYFCEHPPAPLLHRIDYTGRIAIKV